MTFICHKYHIQPIHAKPCPKLVQSLPILCTIFWSYFSHILPSFFVGPILPIFCPFYAPYFAHNLPQYIHGPYFAHFMTKIGPIYGPYFAHTLFMVKIGPIYGPYLVKILVQSCPYFDHIKKPRNRRAFLSSVSTYVLTPGAVYIHHTTFPSCPAYIQASS